MENTKVCSKCDRELPLSEFCKDKHTKDGLCYQCKECRQQYRKQYYTANRELELEQQKQWRADNPDYFKQYDAKRYADNAEYFKQWFAKRYTTLEGYAYNVRHNNLQADRMQGRIGANEDPLPTIEEYIELLQQPDFYDKKQYHWSEMGLDRIDNSKPHTIDNVVPCTTEHNVKRHTMPFEEFCELIQKKVS